MTQTTEAKPHTIRGLSCDNEACGYRNESVELVDYEDYVNEKCPDCGESLLTPEDHAQIKSLLVILDMTRENPNMGEVDGDL